MAKTLEERYNEIYGKGKAAVDEQIAARQATDAETKEKINQSIDKALQTATGQYQQVIDQAPAESRAQYDKNAMADAVNRMRIKESLANMGMTDSGVSSSMQTALAVQKSRADAGVRSAEQKKIQEARNEIARLTAEAEGQKAQSEIDIDRATSEWRNNVMTQLEADSQAAASEAYAADMDYEARVEEAKAKAEQEAIDRADKVLLKMMDNGSTYEQAYAAVYGTPVNTDNQEAYTIGYEGKDADIYTAAGGGQAGADAVGDNAMATAWRYCQGLNTSMTGTGVLWKNKEDDGHAVAERILNQTSGNAQFEAMSPAEKEATLTYAAVMFVKKNWKNAGEAAYQKRLKAVCNDLGVDYNEALGLYESEEF